MNKSYDTSSFRFEVTSSLLRLPLTELQKITKIVNMSLRDEATGTYLGSAKHSDSASSNIAPSGYFQKINCMGAYVGEYFLIERAFSALAFPLLYNFITFCQSHQPFDVLSQVSSC